MAGCGNDTNLTTIHYLADNASDFSVDGSSQEMEEMAENPVVELSTLEVETDSEESNELELQEDETVEYQEDVAEEQQPEDISYVPSEEVNTEQTTGAAVSMAFPQISGFEISDELKSQFNDLLSAYGNDIKFYGISFDGNLSFSYNCNTTFFAASLVKAGYALNLYKQAEAGNLDLNTQLTYQSSMYNDGAGIIRDAPFGTTYTVRELIDYSLRYSDNIAYAMLRDMNGRAYVRTHDNLMSSLGCTKSMLGSKNWSNTSALEMVKIMIEIYNYSLESENGKSMMESLYNSDWNAFRIMLGYKCASKYGYTDNITSVAGIIFADTPYTCCISTPYEEVTCEFITLCNQIVEEYTASLKK
jgi:beta-lactamase class A